MAPIIPPDDEHRTIQQLLPWFVTGQLSAVEAARVQAHIATCSACDAELASEGRLKAGVSGMRPEADAGWARRACGSTGYVRLVLRPNLARPLGVCGRSGGVRPSHGWGGRSRHSSCSLW
jgi:hypothetical protein